MGQKSILEPWLIIETRHAQRCYLDTGIVYLKILGPLLALIPKGEGDVCSEASVYLIQPVNGLASLFLQAKASHPYIISVHLTITFIIIFNF